VSTGATPENWGPHLDRRVHGPVTERWREHVEQPVAHGGETDCSHEPRFVRSRGRKTRAMSERTLHCPGCGQVIEVESATTKARDDDDAPLTCPTCGAGIGRDGELVHDRAIGP
jgi:hypothetical protein